MVKKKRISDVLFRMIGAALYFVGAVWLLAIFLFAAGVVLLVMIFRPEVGGKKQFLNS